MRRSLPAWRKSSRCGGVDNCVEVAPRDGLGGVRDSRGVELWVPLVNVLAFTAAVKAGQFD